MADNEVKLIISADSAGAEAALHRLGQKADSVIGGIKEKWLAMSAAVAAAAITINKAWDLAAMAAGYDEQMTQLNRFAAQYNTTASEVVRSIQEITKGQIALVDIAKISAKALALDVPLDKYKELAKYADAVGDALGMSTTQALEQMSEAAEKGTAKFMKQIVGIVDLEAEYGNLANRMTDQQKAEAMSELMIERLKEKYGDLSNTVVSTADKMEKLTATLKDLQLMLGQGLIRAAAGAMAVFQGIAAVVLMLTTSVFQVIGAFGTLTDAVGLTKGANKEWQQSAEAASAASKELFGKAKDNINLMLSTTEDLGKATEKNKEHTHANKKNIEDMAAATRRWKAEIDNLNPALDQTTKEIENLEQKAVELEAKYGKRKWISEGLEQGLSYIRMKAAKEKETAFLKLEYETASALRQQDLDEQLNAYKVEEEQNKYLHDHLLMTDKEYYASVLRLAEDTANKKKEFAKAEIDDAYKTMQDIYDSNKYTEDEKTKALEEYVKAVIKNNGDILKAAQELADKQIEINRKAAEDFAAGWTQGMHEYQKSTEWGYDKAKALAKDAADSMTAAFQDFFFGKFKDGMAKIVDFFKRMLMQMIATAIANPIIVPIVEVIKQVGGNPATATTAGTGLSGLMGTEIGGTSLGSLLGWGAAGYGIGSAIGGTAGGIGGALGGMAFATDFVQNIILDILGPTIEAALGELADIILPGIGIILGALLGDLFGGKNRPPAMDISYAPGQVPSHIGQGWEGASYQGAGGRWEVVGQHGIDTTALDPIAKAFNDIGDATKDILSKLGLDISGFTKEWHKYIADMSNMTAEQAQAAIEQAMAEYIGFATNIDFTKFQHSGEALIDTVKRIINALGQIAAVIKPSWDETLKTGWDIAKMYDAIDIHANTYKEALNNIDTQIAADVTAMNSGALTTTEWGDKLTEIGTLLVDRYKLEIQYLTYIKQMQEQIANDVKNKITALKLMGMDSAQQWDYLMQEGSTAYTNFMNEVNSATPDATKIVGSYQELSRIFDALVAGIQQLGQAQAAFQTTIDSIQTQYDTMGKTHQQKLAYYNTKIQEAYAAYLAATDPTTKAYYLGEVNKYAQAGWGEMTDAEKQKYGQAVLDWLNQVNEQAKADFQTLLTTAEAFWTAIGNYVHDALKGAVDAETTALNNLATQLNAIDWTPLQDLSSAATAAATSLNNLANADSGNSYASGSDYIPYTQKATIHTGESVITAYGNKALAKMAQKLADMENNGGSTQPVTVVINAQGGDMASFVNYTVKAATSQTIKVIRRNPAVLA